MELQVKVSVETAEMFEELKSYYKETMGMNISKSDALFKAVSELAEIWDQVDWKYISEKKVKFNKYDISASSLRPKLKVTSDVYEKLNELKNILPKILKIRSVTLGVCIKFILKYALIQRDLKQEKDITIKQIIENSQSKYVSGLGCDKTKSVIEKFTMNILVDLDRYEIKIKKK